MPRRHSGMYRAARQAEQSLADAVRAALPHQPIDLDMPLAQACPAMFAPSPADKLALIEASFEALAARCSGERLDELVLDLESLRKEATEQL